MRIVDLYDSGGGLELLRSQGQEDRIRSTANLPDIEPTKGNSTTIKRRIQESLADAGWASDVHLEVDRGPSINSFHYSGVALQVQVGNIARAFYDLMKLEAAWRLGKVKTGVLIVPTKPAARLLGDNLANFERVTEEHSFLFSPVIQLPLVVFAFE